MSNTFGIRVIEWLHERKVLLPFNKSQRDAWAMELDRAFENYQLVPSPKFDDVLRKITEPKRLTASDVFSAISEQAYTGNLHDRAADTTWVDSDINFQTLADALNARLA